MVKDTDISWLAAAFDGEGNLCLYPQRQGKYTTYRPVFQIRNTNAEFVYNAARICAELGATFFKVYETKKTDHDVSPITGKRYKIDFHLQVRGQKAVATVVRALLPLLYCKREFATELLHYLDAIKSRAESRAPKTPWEVEEAERIRAKHMPRSKSAIHAIGKTPPGNREAIPSQAAEGIGSAEGVETSGLSPNDIDRQERPGSRTFPPKSRRNVKLLDREIVLTPGESRDVRINSGREHNN